MNNPYEFCAKVSQSGSRRIKGRIGVACVFVLALFVLTVGCSGSQEDDEQSTDLTGGTSSTGGNTSAIGGTKGSNTGGTSSAGGQSPAGGSSSGGQGGNDPCGGCDEGFHRSLCFSPGLGGEGPDLFRSCLPDGVEC